MQNQQEKYGYDTILRNPTTVKMLAAQIILASDQYISKKMPEKEYWELIIYFANQHGKKLFSYSNSNSLNPTILNRIGKKRAQLVELMLSGYQMPLL